MRQSRKLFVRVIVVGSVFVAFKRNVVDNCRFPPLSYARKTRFNSLQSQTEATN
jgi:hypothetical protein